VPQSVKSAGLAGDLHGLRPDVLGAAGLLAGSCEHARCRREHTDQQQALNGPAPTRQTGPSAPASPSRPASHWRAPDYSAVRRRQWRKSRATVPFLQHIAVRQEGGNSMSRSHKAPEPQVATKPFRPPAVPLVAVDPYFSVWSFADRLTDDRTRHWTGASRPCAAWRAIRRHDLALRWPAPENVPAMDQKELTVLPTRTIYRFEAAGIEMLLTFTTPRCGRSGRVFLARDLRGVGRPLARRPPARRDGVLRRLDGLGRQLLRSADRLGPVRLGMT